MEREDLIEHLLTNSKVLEVEAIREAFEAVDRAHFLHEDYVPEAYEDYAVPIGAEQMMIKPTIMAFMLELLNVQRGDKALDIGSGSGWSTALLSNLVGEKGYVWGIEVQPELVVASQKNIARYLKVAKNAEIIQTTGGFGFKTGQLYDRILFTASVDEVPDQLVRLMAPGATMVLPVGNAIVKVEKNKEGKIKETAYPGFYFDSASI